MESIESENILEIKEITNSIQEILSRKFVYAINTANKKIEGKKKKRILIAGAGIGFSVLFSKLIALVKVFFSLWM